ncbi:MAG: pilus assembly protein [Lachnospiraceae bacterium]|nr:pilus assembly protein [Lachnospiraceae bacterium]
MIKQIKNKKYSGSLTLEAAILLPLFLFLMITILSLMDMLYFYGILEQRLHQIAKKMAVYAPAAELTEEVLAGNTSDSEMNIDSGEISEIAATILGDQYVKNNLIKGSMLLELRSSGVVGKSEGLDFLYSRIMTEGDVIDLVVSYKIEPRNNFFFLPAYSVLNRCRVRAWTGYEVASDSANDTRERMVYITETGTVFHLTKTCTYLDLSIRPVVNDELDLCRNQSGGIYAACELCGDGDAEIYFITDYGECYHTSLTCSGLRRTITEVPISQVGDKSACSRCGTGH